MAVLQCSRALSGAIRIALLCLFLCLAPGDPGHLASLLLLLAGTTLALTLLWPWSWKALSHLMEALYQGVLVFVLVTLAAFAGKIPLGSLHQTGDLLLHGHARLTVPAFLLLFYLQSRIRRKREIHAMMGARYRLDVMPGGHMAIDADLISGYLDADEAHRRRLELEGDSDLFAFSELHLSRAAILTYLCPVVLGLGFTAMLLDRIGPGQPAGLPSDWSAPALGFTVIMTALGWLVTTTVGLVINRRYEEALCSELGEDLGNELPAPAEVVKVTLSTGLEMVTLIGLGLPPGSSMVAHLLIAEKRARKFDPARRWESISERQPRTVRGGKSVTGRPGDFVAGNSIIVELALNLMPLIDPTRGAILLEGVPDLREQLRNELGFLVSPVRFRDTVELPAGRYRVLIGGKAVAEGQIEMGRMLALGSEASLGQLGGRAVVEPAFGMMGRWLRPGRVPAARALGFAVFCPASVLSTHLLETLRQHAGSLLVREELERTLRCANVEMAGPLVSILHQTLCELLPERIGLSDLTRILQLFREGLSHSTDAEHLAETIRRGLGPELYQGYLDSSGELNAIAIDLLDHYGGDRWPEAMLEALEESKEILEGAGFPPVVVTQGENRRELLSLTRQRCLRLVVLSYEELAGESALNILGEVPATALARTGTAPGKGSRPFSRAGYQLLSRTSQ